MKKICFICFLTLFLAFTSALSAPNDFELGKQAFEKQDYNTANTYFVKALSQDPNNATWRYYYAQTLTYLKNYNQAKIEYGYVSQLAPNTTLDSYAKRSIAYLDQIESQNESQNPLLSNAKSTNANNYLTKALFEDGELYVWDITNMPIKVYFDNSARVNAAYVQSAKDALDTWKNATNKLIDFAVVNQKELADVIVTMKSKAPVDAHGPKLKGYTSYTSKDNGYIKKVNVVLYTISGNGFAYTPFDVYATALHEYEHMIGVNGHSDDKNDILFASGRPDGQKQKTTLSSKDINTVLALYTVDRNPYSNNVNAINNVLGSKQDRLNTNLQHSLDYLKTTNNSAQGYLEVAISYKKLGNEYEAINNFNKALQIDPKEKVALGNLASIYFGRNDVKNAELYYNKLITYYPKDKLAYIDLINLYLNNKNVTKAKSLYSSFIYRNPNLKNDSDVIKLKERLSKV